MEMSAWGFFSFSAGAWSCPVCSSSSGEERALWSAQRGRGQSALETSLSPWTLPGFSGAQSGGKVGIFHHDAPDRDREGSLVADGDDGVQQQVIKS